MRKWLKRSLLGLGLIILAWAVLFAWSNSRPVPVIGGTLTQPEQMEIRHLVKKAMWKNEFPNLSWKTFRHSPRALCEMGMMRLGLIELQGSDAAEVAVRSHFGIYYYSLSKNGDQWKILWRQNTPNRHPLPPPIQPGPKTETDFSLSLSNRARVSY